VEVNTGGLLGNCRLQIGVGGSIGSRVQGIGEALVVRVLVLVMCSWHSSRCVGGNVGRVVCGGGWCTWQS